MMGKCVRGGFALAAGVLVCLTLSASAESKKGEKGKPRSDKEFAELAGSAGALEIQSSRLALERSTNADVKKFAQHMIDDHTKASKELKTVASGKGITISDTLNREDQAVLGKLTGIKDAGGFDVAYMHAQVKAHKAAVKLFSEEAEQGKDADVKAFATKTLPTLKMHLEMAEKTCKACEAKSGTKPAEKK